MKYLKTFKSVLRPTANSKYFDCVNRSELTIATLCTLQDVSLSVTHQIVH